MDNVMTRKRHDRKYRAHPLLRSGHLQTIFGAIISGELPPYSATQHVINLPDGESLVVHEERSESLPPDAPLAVLVHGLGGDHRSPYMRRIAHRLTKAGLRVWRVDLRGCGAGLQYAYRPAHAGTSADLAAVLAEALRKYPAATLGIAAYSLGGNILLKMLGELAEGTLAIELDRHRIVQALAVAPPADLQGCCANMERWSRMSYTRYYLKMLGRQVQARAAKWEQWRDIRPTSALRTIRHFDQWYTAPLSGFESTEEYYARSSAKNWLGKIDVPTRILLDEHDPIIPFAAFNGIQFSPSTQIEVTRFGGHLGYLAAGPRGSLHRWMDEWTVEALR